MLGTWPHDPSRGVACTCLLGPFPDDPLRRGLNSSTPHTDTFCIPPQFASFPSGLSTVLPCLLLGLLPLDNGCHLPSCGLCATVGWVGVPKFFCPGLPSPRGVSEGRCFSQPAVLKAHTGTSQCEPHPAGGWWFSAQAQRRRSLMDAVGQHAGAG